MPPCSGSVQCTVYRVQSTVHSVQCTVCSVQCTVYSVQCAVYSVQCTVRSVQCTVYSAECTEYSVQCTVYSVPYTVYTVKSTVYSGQCTVYSVRSITAHHIRMMGRWSGAGLIPLTDKMFQTYFLTRHDGTRNVYGDRQDQFYDPGHHPTQSPYTCFVFLKIILNSLKGLHSHPRSSTHRRELAGVSREKK
jgi:hypothetical protein